MDSIIWKVFHSIVFLKFFDQKNTHKNKYYKNVTMKKIFFLINLLTLICYLEVNASRAMYVDGFATILGDVTAENNLLSYAQSNGIETLLLYELHLINANYNLANAATNSILANFISKAKTSYGIINMGATSESPNSFTNVIDPYNNSRNDPNEKFDIYNLEFEFWIANSTKPGAYYCTSYLTPNGLTCDNDGAFQFFISTLQTMNNLAANNSHPITVEAYVGWPTEVQAHTISTNLDRLLLHAYVSSPEDAFDYSKERLINFANGKPGLAVSIIFSSEPVFMQSWLTNNSMDAAETIFSTNWMNASATWTNNINLEGFTYFNYSDTLNTTLSTDNASIAEAFKIYPNPVQNILSLEHLSTIKNVRIFTKIGQLILETKEKHIDFNKFANGVYFLQIDTSKGMETKKVIKK